MSRKPARQQIGVALFPFLAVLICTMGALIVLLVLLVQQARVDASTIASRQRGALHQAQADEDELQQRLEDARWQRELLDKSRAEKTEELAQSRARLAHLEDHIQRLEEQARQLLERAKSIDEGKQLRDDELAAARAEAERLKAEISRKRVEIAEMKKKGAGQADAYALIPYDGPSGTRRRPIYIECTEFGVILQPEGLILKSEDFSGPMGPGNPLDTALRAIREHIERTAGNKAGLPYPLIVVRPGGVVAYGAARAAMRSWDDEFGYELISDDKQLDFGPPDPALSRILTKSVADARQRQAMMAAMMPRQFQGQEPLRSFAAEPATAVAPATGAGVGSGLGGRRGRAVGGLTGSSPMGGAGVSGNGAAQGSGTAPGGMAGPRGGATGGSGSGFPGVSSTGGLPPVTAGFSAAPQASAAFGQEYTARGSDIAGSGGSFAGASLAAGNGAGGSGGSGAGGSGLVGGASPGQPAGAATPGDGPSGPAGASGAGGPSAAAAFSGQPGGSSGSNNGGLAGGASGAMSAGGSPGGAAGGGSALTMSGQPGAAAGPNMNFEFGPKKSASQGSGGAAGARSGARSGKSRGSNWALLNVKPHSVGVTRPIHIQVLNDRIVMLPERGDSRAPLVVKIAPELTPEDVNRFVAAVQGEIKGWGLAVADGYWKPVLQADVAPDSERNLSNLKTALEGSGIEIVRK